MLKRATFFAAVWAILCVGILAGAQERKWAGRALDNLEGRIHNELATLPFYGVFDTLRFERQGPAVILSGQVTRETVKSRAEQAVARIEGVQRVVNQIEVIPASKHDDAIRVNVYQAIYGSPEFEKYRMRPYPPVHIIVKSGTVSLEGVVDSPSDLDAVYLRALTVVHSITNNLRIAPEE